MEIKKNTTLRSIFMKYILLFCVLTLALFAAVIMLYNLMIRMGVILPVNDAETRIDAKIQEIRAAETVSEEMLPSGCTYGVYQRTGTFIYGNLESSEQKKAWSQYEADDKTAGGRYYYRFIPRGDDVCIIKYALVSRFAGEHMMPSLFPNPELLMILLYVVLFLLQTILLARYFAGSLSRQLHLLDEVTGKIQQQDLEMEEQHSDIQEIDQILSSLYQMRTALHGALEEQWSMEAQRREQIDALAHDIKTPLTVIRGNAELLMESDLTEADQICSRHILKNAAEIERYLDLLKGVLETDAREMPEPEKSDCAVLVEQLKEQASAIIYADGRECRLEEGEIEGNITCNPVQIMRAWNNIVSNAVEHTPSGTKIYVRIGLRLEDTVSYLCAAVIDEGNGFSAKGLRHAKEQFYQEEQSRHDRKNRGLGLFTASRLAQAQGGKVVLENAEETGGAKVSLWIKIDRRRE